MRLYRLWFQHVTNPLHIYCRLIDIGLNENFSKRLIVIYEKHFHPSLSKDMRLKWNFLIKKYL